MGKKYENLKEALARNPARELLVINDQLIREKYFNEANDILLKIEKLEEKIRIFHSTDQRLFDQWYKLTFRKDQEQVDQTQAEFHEIAKFHNWVVATAHMLDLEMSEAYALMKDEVRRYENGSVEERRQIDEDRRKRDEFIEFEVNSKYNEKPEFEFNVNDDEEKETGESQQLETLLNHLENLILPDDRDMDLDLSKRIARLMALTDDEYEYWMKEQEICFLLFDISLTWGENEKDYSFFLRVWSLMNKPQRALFAEVYGALTGRSIEEFVRQLKREQRQKQEFQDIEDDDEFEFDAEFFDLGGNQKAYAKDRLNAPEEEKLKGLYRKLIRKLHPDLHTGQREPVQEGWIKRVWDLVQKAYNSKDTEKLDQLLKLTLLRTHSLDQLTLDEIIEARRHFENDLDTLESEAKNYKRTLAWGFSAKKSYEALTKKIKAQFQQSLNSIRFQIEELQGQHRTLEMILNMELEHQQQKRSRTEANRSHNRRRKPRRRFEDDDQESFSY